MFKLHMTVTRPSVDALKAELTKTLSDVKSSHRCEALARAFGFRTYAAMLSATDCGLEAGRRLADGVTFAAYLADHGFDADTTVFQRAVGRMVLSEILVREPELNREGIGAGDRRRVDGVWETSTCRAARVARSRAGFTDDYCVGEFLRALAFVSKIAAIKVNNGRAGSYGLKHDAEHFTSSYPEGQPLGPDYVSNGAFIAAAIHAGFVHRQVIDVLGRPSLNATFNMSSRSIGDLRGVRAA